MNRREAVKSVALLPVLGAVARSQPAAPGKLKFLSPAQSELVATLAELIIPRTDTPGARDARVHLYIDQVLAAATDTERADFLKGLAYLEGLHFLKLTPAQQTAILEPMAAIRAKFEDESAHQKFFTRLKSLTITGYYTSSEGVLRELGYQQGFTGEFPGCTHAEGDHA